MGCYHRCGYGVKECLDSLHVRMMPRREKIGPKLNKLKQDSLPYRCVKCCFIVSFFVVFTRFTLAMCRHTEVGSHGLFPISSRKRINCNCNFLIMPPNRRIKPRCLWISIAEMRMYCCIRLMTGDRKCAWSLTFHLSVFLSFNY